MTPSAAPPTRFDGVPPRFVLPAGSTLTRIHDARFGVTEFNPTVPGVRHQGGRFDASPDDQYSYLYAAGDDMTALAEALLRDVAIDGRGARLLPHRNIEHARIGWLRSTRDLHLVSLRSGRDLAAIGQDGWLTSAPSAEYEVTRRWAASLRSWDREACGLTWRSRLNPDGMAYVFFGDRVEPGDLDEQHEGLPILSGDRELAVGDAARYIRRLLAEYRVTMTR